MDAGGPASAGNDAGGSSCPLAGTCNALAISRTDLNSEIVKTSQHLSNEPLTTLPASAGEHAARAERHSALQSHFSSPSTIKRATLAFKHWSFV
jgi:hypothetical protein